MVELGGTVGGVDPAGGLVVLEPVLDPEVEPMPVSVEPVVPVLDPAAEPVLDSPMPEVDPLLIPLDPVGLADSPLMPLASIFF